MSTRESHVSGPFKRVLFALVAVFLCTLVGFSSVGNGARAGSPDWLSQEFPIATRKLFANISPPGTHPGVVIASPQKSGPDYFFHWVRDSALTMDVVAKLYRSASDAYQKDRLRALLRNYADFSRQNQLSNAITGLGEPKFTVFGAPYMEDWGRPQNDGPAIRASTLIQFAHALLDEGQGAYVSAVLYDGKTPTSSVIKADLEYVSHHWSDPSYDLWEEVKGDHFYTRMVQRKALLDGAALANRLGDPGAAAWYQIQARALEPEIAKHWDASRRIIVPTLNRVSGIDYKYSGIDIAVVLGALHGDRGDGFFTIQDPRVQATMDAIEQTFARLYPINANGKSPGVLIGRYPEDVYGGASFDGGNPWVLATLALAEAHFRIGGAAHLAKAQSFVDSVANHAEPDGSLAEQIQRYSGRMTSAADLTWNYAAVITTLSARQYQTQVR